MDIVKVGVFGIATALLSIPLQKEKKEYSVLLGMAACTVLFAFLITKIQLVLEFVQKLESMTSVDSYYIGLVIKMIGITYIGQFSAGICKDAGHQAPAAQIELFCRLSVLVQSMPILLALLDTIQEFMT